jgi:hypothetical protein
MLDILERAGMTDCKSCSTPVHMCQALLSEGVGIRCAADTSSIRGGGDLSCCGYLDEPSSYLGWEQNPGKSRSSYRTPLQAFHGPKPCKLLVHQAQL